jgi:hypothetical protein
MRSLEILNNISVASPCDAEWNDMRGDERVRHCLLCDRNVYNLSAMKADEAMALIEDTEGRICARFFRRADGTLLTADCPVGVRAALMRARQSTLRALAMVISFAITGAIFLLARGGAPIGGKGCDTGVEAIMGEMAPPEHVMGRVAPPEIKGEIEMGDVAVAP